MTQATRTRLFPVLAISSVLAACGGGSDSGSQNLGPVEGEDSQFVVSDVLIPSNASEITKYSHDLDGDNRVTNQIGSALQAVKNAGGDIDLQGRLSEAVRAGELVLLINARSTSQNSAQNAGSWVFLGDKNNINPAPCTDPENLETCGQHLQGNGTFTVDSTSPTDSLLRGDVTAGEFAGGPGTVILPFALAEGAEPVNIELIGAHTKFTYGASGELTGGVLAGGISEAQMDQAVLPAVYELVADLVATDCTGEAPNCCAANSTGDRILQFLNGNESDCSISEAQFRNHSLIQLLLRSDVDLMNGDTFDPGVDGIPDAVSFGLGFTATTASFPLPSTLAQ